MPHPSQKTRADNIEVCMLLIARTGKKGALERELMAVLSLKPYGFHPQTVESYLATLEQAGRIVKKGERWKLTREA